MKNNFPKTLGAGILTLTMGILPLNLLNAPAQAQVNQPRTDVAPDRTVYYDRHDFDWGWLGLIGLLGLAGLAGKRREEQPTRYRDPNTPGATSYRD